METCVVLVSSPAAVLAPSEPSRRYARATSTGHVRPSIEAGRRDQEEVKLLLRISGLSLSLTTPPLKHQSGGTKGTLSRCPSSKRSSLPDARLDFLPVAFKGLHVTSTKKNSVRTLRIETPLWQMLYTQASLVLGSDKG